CPRKADSATARCGRVPDPLGLLRLLGRDPVRLSRMNHPPPRRAPVHKSTGARRGGSHDPSPVRERALPGRCRRVTVAAGGGDILAPMRATLQEPPTSPPTRTRARFEFHASVWLSPAAFRISS